MGEWRGHGGTRREDVGGAASPRGSGLRTVVVARTGELGVAHPGVMVRAGLVGACPVAWAWGCPHYRRLRQGGNASHVGRGVGTVQMNAEDMRSV